MQEWLEFNFQDIYLSIMTTTVTQKQLCKKYFLNKLLHDLSFYFLFFSNMIKKGGKIWNLTKKNKSINYYRISSRFIFQRNAPRNLLINIYYLLIFIKFKKKIYIYIYISLLILLYNILCNNSIYLIQSRMNRWIK